MGAEPPGSSARWGDGRCGRSAGRRPRRPRRRNGIARPPGTGCSRWPARPSVPTRRWWSRTVGYRGPSTIPRSRPSSSRSPSSPRSTVSEASGGGRTARTGGSSVPPRRRPGPAVGGLGNSSRIERPARTDSASTSRAPLDVDAESVRAAARREPALFLCHDPRTRRLMVAPHTPCPILFGLRSRTLEGALRARPWIRSEPVDRWLMFRTNQATGDHLRGNRPEPLAPYTPSRLRGFVAERPVSLRGGHVALSLVLPSGTVVACRVFEPTKTLPPVARELGPGDEVEFWGGTGPDPLYRVEGIRVRHWGPGLRQSVPPRCPNCRRRARSLGSARGYRCPGCHRRWPPESARRTPIPRTVALGTYHPTPSARRHLAPLGPEPAAK